MPSADPYQAEAVYHRILSNPKCLKLLRLCEEALERGETVFPSKKELVRRYRTRYREQVKLNNLNHAIEVLAREEVLSRVASPRGVARVGHRVEMRINGRAVRALLARAPVEGDLPDCEATVPTPASAGAGEHDMTDGWSKT